jgi:hypothetical protein
MAILAQMAAAVLTSVLYQTNQSLYVSMCGGSLPDPGTFWVIQLAMGLCIAVVNIGISAGLGIAGSSIWVSFERKKMHPTLPPPPGG